MGTYVEHVQLLVSDLDRAADFYLTVFPSWKIRARGHETGPRAYAWIHVGTDQSYISIRTHYESVASETPASVEKHSNHIGIVVDEDIELVVRRLNELGAQVIKNDHPYRTRVYTRDPDGYELELVHYSTADATRRNDYSHSVQAGVSIVDGIPPAPPAPTEPR